MMNVIGTKLLKVGSVKLVSAVLKVWLIKDVMEFNTACDQLVAHVASKEQSSSTITLI